MNKALLASAVIAGLLSGKAALADHHEKGKDAKHAEECKDKKKGGKCDHKGSCKGMADNACGGKMDKKDAKTEEHK